MLISNKILTCFITMLISHLLYLVSFGNDLIKTNA